MYSGYITRHHAHRDHTAALPMQMWGQSSLSAIYIRLKHIYIRLQGVF